MNKTVEEQFNYWDLPRDGQTFFAKDNLESLALFLDMSSNATYVLVPAPYVELLVKWAAQTDCIQLAPMVAENVAGGFFGTVNSVEIFSDIYASPKFSYVRGAPIVFGQWGGAFSRILERERTPYYSARENAEGYFVTRSEGWDKETLFVSGDRPERILIPQRFYPAFLNAMDYASWEVRKESSNIEQHFNGHIGWYNSVPVYTDSYMHRRMINEADLVEVHYKWKQPPQKG